ncbi:MAG: cadherin-like beta sandwich domain-containing protein [Roseburia sp.]|nr:cadherin-like beta sandwich domain-containing protein [Roseburia sp.]
MLCQLHINSRKWIRVAAICIALAAVGISLYCFSDISYADTVSTGTIIDGPVQVRKAPVNGEKITTLDVGTTVTVVDEVTGSDGYVWYQIEVVINNATITGYTRSDFISITPADEAYIASLKTAGFPDSYCDLLAALHQKYPDWQFEAVQTGLDWNTVIENESTAGKNLVQSSSNDARKSTDSAAYDWATNTWYGYDGAGWVCASPEYIAYCMDPRNFLNETYIFQFETLEYASYQNADGVKNILANTFMSGNYNDRDGVTRSYADTFVEVGSSLGVSPYHLASRCRQEQGSGTSDLISGMCPGFEGYYNYFNVGAYTANGATAAVNGLIYAKNQGWDTIYKSIAGGSKVVAENYIKKGQNTIYFEKFNVVYQNSLYSHQYMTNVQAAMSEGSSMGKAYADKNQAFVFRIPVYENMPDTAVTFKDAGNPNNWLTSLTVEGYDLTPAFSGANTTYSLVVGSDVSSIRVAAKAVASTSGIAGTGDYSLNYGNNTITVTCTSQSGAARVYTITVARQEPPVSGNTIPVAEGATITTDYPIGTYLTGVLPETGADTLLAGITAVNCQAKLLAADGTENTGRVGTGNRLAIYVNDTLVKEYEVVIYGDINGDGKISNVDFVLLQKQILGITLQSGSYLEAANTSRDGGVSNKDFVILQKHILNISQIVQ